MRPVRRSTPETLCICARSWVRVQGRDSMKEFLREHPDVSDQIEAEIRANAHKLMSPQARKAAIASGRAVEVAADDFQG